jgi:hypothetical protein
MKSDPKIDPANFVASTIVILGLIMLIVGGCHELTTHKTQPHDQTNLPE